MRPRSASMAFCRRTGHSLSSSRPSRSPCLVPPIHILRRSGPPYPILYSPTFIVRLRVRSPALRCIGQLCRFRLLSLCRFQYPSEQLDS
jgi:hypothetical protein